MYCFLVKSRTNILQVFNKGGTITIYKQRNQGIVRRAIIILNTHPKLLTTIESTYLLSLANKL